MRTKMGEEMTFDQIADALDALELEANNSEYFMGALDLKLQALRELAEEDKNE